MHRIDLQLAAGGQKVWEDNESTNATRRGVSGVWCVSSLSVTNPMVPSLFPDLLKHCRVRRHPIKYRNVIEETAEGVILHPLSSCHCASPRIEMDNE
jgi:hypothetical protein